MGDNRYLEWRSQIPNFPFGDLLDLPAPEGQVTICYGPAAALDTAHAQRILSAWGGHGIRVEDGATTPLEV